MIKRTLWYAFLVLLCCGTAALVVNATTVGKPAPTTTALSVSVTPDAAPVVNEDAAATTASSGIAEQSGMDSDPVLQAKAIYERWIATGTVTPAEKALVEQYIFAPRAQNSQRNPLDDQGGPDGWGYRFVDNLAADTATYNWIELRGDAGVTWINAWASYDDGCATVAHPLGLTFPFYGTNYTTFTPTSNGQISFGTCNAYNYYSCLPNAGVGPAIFPFLYDLHLQRGGDATGNLVVGYKNFGTYTVIEFDSIGYYSSSYTGSSLKFQVILYSNGRMKLQYNNMVYVGAPPMGTVGIQNNAGATNLQYRCYTDANTVRPLTNGRAIWFYPSGAEPTGRCCYGPDPLNPLCANNTLAQCGVLGGTWTLGLNCAANPCNACADFTLTAPGTVSGNTLGAGDNCALRVGEDQIVAVTIPNAGNWSFSLCPTGAWDTYIYLNTACCGGTTLAQNDDYCGLTSEINCYGITAPGTYYVDIEPWSGGGGAWTLVVSQCAPPQGRCCYGPDPLNPLCANNTQAECTALSGTWTAGQTCAANPCPFPLTCPPGGIQENEPLCADNYVDAYNGGCNSTPNIFQTINCGDVICGKSGTFLSGAGNSRDTDWFTLTTTTPQVITWSVTAEFPVLIFTINSPCPAVIRKSITANPNAPATIVDTLATPGTYYLWVGPSAFTGVACDADYIASLTCQTYVPPTGRCCYNGGANCVDVTQAACIPLGGTWTGGMTCAGNPCPVAPANDNCQGAGTPAAVPVTFTGDNTGATVDCPAGGYPEVWHAIVTTTCMNLVLDYCGTTPVFGNVYIVMDDACPCDGTWIFATNWNNTSCDGNWQVNFNALPAGTYYLPVLMETGSVGPYTLNVTGVACPPPPPPCVDGNDACANITNITTCPFTCQGSTVGYVNDYTTCISNTAPDRIYSFTTQAVSDVVISLCGSTYDTALELRTGGACPGTTQLYCNDDFCGLQSQITATALPVGTYYVIVDGYSSSSGTYNLNITANPCFSLPCNEATNVTNLLNVTNTQVIVRWNAPAAGNYKVYSSTVRNNDGNPDGGADPDFVLATTVAVAAPGPASWTDPAAPVAYKNYVVTQSCP